MADELSASGCGVETEEGKSRAIVLESLVRILGKLLTPYLRHDRVESLVMKSALCLQLGCKLLNNVYLVCVSLYTSVV